MTTNKDQVRKVHHYIEYIWLVVWNMAFIFPYIGNVIIPTDFRIFQRDWNRQPVNILIVAILLAKTIMALDCCLRHVQRFYGGASALQ